MELGIVYHGETPPPITVDLDSETTAAYDLTGITAVVRVRKPGETDTALQVAAATLDSAAGTVTVELGEVTLAPGFYEAQLVDTARPFVLATGGLTVMEMLPAV